MGASDKYHALLEVDVFSDTSIDISELKKAISRVCKDHADLAEVRLVVSETPEKISKYPNTKKSFQYDTSFDFGHNVKSTSSATFDPPVDLNRYALKSHPIKPREVTFHDISEPHEGPVVLRPPPLGIKAYVEPPPSTSTYTSKEYSSGDLFAYSTGRAEKPGGKKVSPAHGLPSFESRDGEWRCEWEWPQKGETGLALTLCAQAKYGWESIETLTEIADLTSDNEQLRALSFNLFEKLKGVPTKDFNRTYNVFQKWAKKNGFTNDEEIA